MATLYTLSDSCQHNFGQISMEILKNRRFNTVVNLSLPLVTRLASSIQLGRRERERGTTHDSLSLQQSRAGSESHLFDTKRSKKHGFDDSRPTISTPTITILLSRRKKKNPQKSNPSASSNPTS